MSHKIDDRKDNISKIKETIKNTQDNMEFAEDMIESISDEKQIRALEAQNQRRAESIEGLQEDLKGQIEGKENKRR